MTETRRPTIDQTLPIVLMSLVSRVPTRTVAAEQNLRLSRPRAVTSPLKRLTLDTPDLPIEVVRSTRQAQ